MKTRKLSLTILIIFLILSLTLNISQVLAASEDLSTYTEYEEDAGSITVSPNTNVTGDPIDRDSVDYLYKDHGAAAFEDFEINLDVWVESKHTSSIFYVFMTSTYTAGWSPYTYYTSNNDFIGFQYSGGNSNGFRLRECDAGTLYSSSWYTPSVQTWYYIVLKKATTSFALEIYSDTARTTLLSNLTLTLQNDYSMRYMFPVSSYDTNTAAVQCNVTVSNIDLAGGGSPVFPNNITIDSPSNNTAITLGSNQNFTYTPLIFQAIENASLWINISGSWQNVGNNASTVLNNTLNGINYTISTAGTYIWNIRVFNSTHAIWGENNRTIIVENYFLNVTGSDYHTAWTYSNTTQILNNQTFEEVLHSGLYSNASSIATPGGSAQTHRSIIFVQNADYFSAWLYYPSALNKARNSNASFVTTNTDQTFLTMGLYTELPSISNFTITNAEECSTIPVEINYRYWVYAQTKFYHFQGTFSNINGWDQITQVSMQFTNGWQTVTATYYRNSTGSLNWTLDNGGEYVYFAPNYDLTYNSSNTDLVITWDLFFRESVYDTANINVFCDIYAYNAFGVLVSTGYLDTNYTFSIYNLGGETDYTFYGSGGHTSQGDTFELYAGGSYGADILEEDYELGLSPNYQVYAEFWGNETTENFIYEEDIPYLSAYPESLEYFPQRAIHMQKGNTGTSDTVNLYLTFERQGEAFYYQVYVMAEQTDENITISIMSDSSPAVWLVMNSTGGFHYTTGAGDQYTSQAYAANDWINLTLYLDPDADTFDLWVDSSLIVNDGAFLNAQTSINRMYINLINNVGTSTPPFHFWFDQLKIWRSSAGGTGGYSVATMLYRNLQHVHAQFALGIEPTGTVADYAIQDADTGFIELGIDYCVDNVWVDNAWKVRLNITQASLVGYSTWNTITGLATSNWVQVNATWYIHNSSSIAKQETFYTFWEGLFSGESTTDRVRLWLDLWFNRQNASSIAGGRISSYYYGVYEGTHPWLRWAQGSNWQIMGKENQKSDFFMDLIDAYDNANVTAHMIDLVRFRVKLYRTTDYDYKWVLKDWDQLTFDQSAGEMRGINTPSFIAPIIPTLPAGGLWGVLAGFFQWVINALIDAVTWAALEAWGLLVGFLDTIAAYMGYPGFFSEYLFPAIASMFGQFVNSLIYIVSLIEQVFRFIGVIFAPFMTFFVQVITYWIELAQFMIDIFNGVYETGINFVEWFGITHWITLIALLYPVYLVALVAEDMSLDPLVWHATQWKNIIAFLIMVFKTIIELTLKLITTIIESIPVVE